MPRNDTVEALAVPEDNTCWLPWEGRGMACNLSGSDRCRQWGHFLLVTPSMLDSSTPGSCPARTEAELVEETV